MGWWQLLVKEKRAQRSRLTNKPPSLMLPRLSTWTTCFSGGFPTEGPLRLPPTWSTIRTSGWMSTLSLSFISSFRCTVSPRFFTWHGQLESTCWRVHEVRIFGNPTSAASSQSRQFSPTHFRPRPILTWNFTADQRLAEPEQLAASGCRHAQENSPRQHLRCRARTRSHRPDCVQLGTRCLRCAQARGDLEGFETHPLRGCNLVEGDFFRLVSHGDQGSRTILNERFDVVVGNPPFESALTEPGKRLNKNAQEEHPERGRLPDNQVAYLFLEQAFQTVRSDVCVCLIQPHGLLYDRKARAFSAFLWNHHQVDSILDFTSIRNLYTADPKTVAVCARVSPPPADHSIQHWTFRRTFTVHQRICFELDVSFRQACMDLSGGCGIVGF